MFVPILCHRGRDRMVVEFLSTYAVSATKFYHGIDYILEFETMWYGRGARNG